MITKLEQDRHFYIGDSNSEYLAHPKRDKNTIYQIWR